MKNQAVFFVLTLSLILPGCAVKKNLLTNRNKPESTVVAELPAQPKNMSEPEPASTSENPGPYASPIPAAAYTPPDYSDHSFPNEEKYITALADLSKLKDGERVIIKQEMLMDVSGFENGENSGLTKKVDGFGYDVRYLDLSGEDLSTVDDWNNISFSQKTVWPEILPEGFDPEYIIEFNKNPGLGIRALHEEGITGAGVKIAMIDSTLLTSHEQYESNLMLYEKIHSWGDYAFFHGTFMASHAVGKDIGVAPGAKLYYIASDLAHNIGRNFYRDASVMADCILRVLEINRHLPANEKIRVISISNQYTGDEPGFYEMNDAIKKAEDENIFVITASTYAYFDFSLFAMGRDYLSDPDDFNSYRPWNAVSDHFYKSPDMYKNRILAPAGGRTYAAFYGAKNYEVTSWGGISAAVAWFSGFYALCCQVKPEITPREFIEIVKATAVTANIDHEGTSYSFGQIVNPAAVIAELRK